MIGETTVYLGPASVLCGGSTGDVQVACPDGSVLWARMALALPYTPAAGDEVLLVHANGPQAYVIGVLRGQGSMTLRVPGDLKLQAPHGSVHIAAGRAVHIESEAALEFSAPRATLRFARLDMLVSTLVQRVNDAFTWATGLVQSRSRRVRWRAEEGLTVRAGRAHLKTQGNVRIDGKTVHLG